MERSKESCELVREIFQEVTKVLDNYHYTSYHVFCNVINERWSLDLSTIYFTVSFWSDQWNGSEWEEEWYIDSEGIHTNDKIYKTLEDFKRNW